jgi:hypothetical protein
VRIAGSASRQGATRVRSLPAWANSSLGSANTTVVHVHPKMAARLGRHQLLPAVPAVSAVRPKSQDPGSALLESLELRGVEHPETLPHHPAPRGGNWSYRHLPAVPRSPERTQHSQQLVWNPAPASGEALICLRKPPRLRAGTPIGELSELSTPHATPRPSTPAFRRPVMPPPSLLRLARQETWRVHPISSADDTSEAAGHPGVDTSTASKPCEHGRATASVGTSLEPTS